jgi:pimeloyl-ACP methyl ester carboxylesterase
MSVKLFYRKYGEGPPLVILHGLYGSSDNWMTIARKISNIYTVWLPDLRNHGSSPHDSTHSFEAMADDLSELAEKNNLGKFFLAGHSMGGKAAILFALKWPEKLNGLLIADVSPFTVQASVSLAYDYHSRILSTVSRTDISGASSRKEIETLLSSGISSSRDIALIMKNLKRNADNSYSWKINAPVLLRHLREMIEGLVLPPVGEHGITGFPVIFLKGENSEYLDQGDYTRILKLFPAAEFRIVKNAGHWIHADNPEAVAEALGDLMK